jgi:hypothetical protein
MKITKQQLREIIGQELAYVLLEEKIKNQAAQEEKALKIFALAMQKKKLKERENPSDVLDKLKGKKQEQRVQKAKEYIKSTVLTSGATFLSLIPFGPAIEGALDLAYMGYLGYNKKFKSSGCRSYLIWTLLSLLPFASMVVYPIRTALKAYRGDASIKGNEALEKEIDDLENLAIQAAKEETAYKKAWERGGSPGLGHIKKVDQVLKAAEKLLPSEKYDKMRNEIQKNLDGNLFSDIEKAKENNSLPSSIRGIAQAASTVVTKLKEYLKGAQDWIVTMINSTLPAKCSWWNFFQEQE